MNKKGSLWILTGIILICAALGLLIYNFCVSEVAGKRAGSAAEQLEETTPDDSLSPSASDGEVTYPDYILNPYMDMPVQKIDGYSYIGLLEIPALELTLPIQKEWSYPNMKVSPCRYAGSVYLDNMVICGHNYTSHFGTLKNLNKGDAVYFIDTDGNRFEYKVEEIEVLLPDAVEEMVSEDWDLTLFTCTVGGASRVTVRCSRSRG